MQRSVSLQSEQPCLVPAHAAKVYSGGSCILNTHVGTLNIAHTNCDNFTHIFTQNTTGEKDATANRPLSVRIWQLNYTHTHMSLASHLIFRRAAPMLNHHLYMEGVVFSSTECGKNHASTSFSHLLGGLWSCDGRPGQERETKYENEPEKRQVF